MKDAIAAYLWEDSLYLAASSQATNNVIAVQQGMQVCDLEEVDQGALPKDAFELLGSICFLKDHDGEWIRENCQTVLESGLNAITNLSLKGGQTLHIRLKPPSEGNPSVIPLQEEIRVRVESDGDWLFTGLLACHRATAKLELSWRQGARQFSEGFVFNTESLGGTQREGYQFIEKKIPLKKGIADFSLRAIHYSSFSDSKGRSNSLLFVANAFLAPVSNAKNTPIPGKPRLFGEKLSLTETPTCYRAHIMPFASKDDNPIALQLNDGRVIDLYHPIKAEIKLKADYGHTLQLEVREERLIKVYINNEPSLVQKLRAGENTLRLPQKWLLGEPILVQIRDASGSQIFLSHPMLAPRQITPEDVLLRETRRPFPTDLTSRANQRYQSLRAHLRQPIPGISQNDLLQALDTLDGNYATVNLKPLSFPKVEIPRVSIVMPAHNKVEATYYALCSLLLAHNATNFEVIVVDDGSTDQTAELEELVQGIRVIHHEEPQRFIKACNRGASEARGHYLVLLNNDTEVTVGWLDALVDAFQRFDGVGAVGSKLLYPDGTLQDAGGIIWGSGNPWNYGCKQNPWDPRFCYTRQVDYLSGAALMTTKAIWDEVGGLSSYLEPMYFEDTDFSFKVREAGYKTIFVPSSMVYHFEGTTSGTDTSSGFKKYQEVNRPKFKRRWAKAFASHGQEGKDPDLEKDRGIAGRVLFIDYTTPREDQNAGAYAAIREIELVQALGYKVTFLPQNLAFFGNYTEKLQQMGVEVITAPFYLSLAEALKERAKEFDAAYITRYNVAADTVHLIRKHSPKTRIMLNNADLHFLRELRAALSENNEQRLEVMRNVRSNELEMMQSVDLVLSYNEVEHAVISSHTDGQVKVLTCPWVVQIPDTVAPLEGRSGLSFIGSFKHHPNAEGVQWFCREVMPQLGGQQMKLSIYGSGMGKEVKKLSSEWIDPVGFIEDLADAYQPHRVFVAPLLSGAGIKGKVLNALAYGLPTVLTPTAAEGIGLRHGHDCLIAKTPEEWVAAITRLNQDDELWHSMSKAARTYVASQFSFEAGKATMKAAFEAVDLFSHMDE